MNQIIQDEINWFRKLRLQVFVIPITLVVVALIIGRFVDLSSHSMWVSSDTQFFLGWITAIPTALNILLLCTIAPLAHRRLEKIAGPAATGTFQQSQFKNHIESVRSSRILLIILAVLMSPGILLIFGTSVGTALAGVIILISFSTHLVLAGALAGHLRRIAPKTA